MSRGDPQAVGVLLITLSRPVPKFIIKYKRDQSFIFLFAKYFVVLPKFHILIENFYCFIKLFLSSIIWLINIFDFYGRTFISKFRILKIKMATRIGETSIFDKHVDFKIYLSRISIC